MQVRYDIKERQLNQVDLARRKPSKRLLRLKMRKVCNVETFIYVISSVYWNRDAFFDQQK